MLLSISGGIGLFLLGMIIMTQALPMLAGQFMRKILMTFTRSPLTGAITGAISTAILQSSSSTIVAAIGFVSAGLLTYSESLGIIFGANIGTTITGWLVTVIGFKLKLGNLMYGLLFIGVLLRLTMRGRMQQLGMVLSGFSLIFIGIEILQTGMTDTQQILSGFFSSTDTLSGILRLVAVGMIFTTITQSSSAGVASALTALYTETISFEQAAALVIGMDVGTTFKAALASVGGSISARRTGFSHVIYNFMTACGALLLLTPYIAIWNAISDTALQENAQFALVGFHSIFNILGVIIVLPFTSNFAHLIMRMIPDKADEYTQPLDHKLLNQPDLALTAVIASIRYEILALFNHTLSMLSREDKSSINLTDLQHAIDETQNYADLIHIERSNQLNWDNLVSVMHTLDHIQRLHERCSEDQDRATTAKYSEPLQDDINHLYTSLQLIIGYIEINDWNMAYHDAISTAIKISTHSRTMRHAIIASIAEGELDISSGTSQLEAIRWLRRVSAHILKIAHHQRDIYNNLKV